jgi:prophage regulatory protein
VSTKRLLRRPAIEGKTGLRRSQIYEYVAQGRFPSPVRIGPRAVAWVEEEIDAWIDARIAERVTEHKSGATA